MNTGFWTLGHFETAKETETVKTQADKRPYGVITTRRINAKTYHLTIGGVLWSEVEWSSKRAAWCIQDAAGQCLTHVESIVGQDRDPDAALRLARRMILDGRMPTPEEARARRQANQDRARLGEPITGDITASGRAPILVPEKP
jgi:hypothetical protein